MQLLAEQNPRKMWQEALARDFEQAPEDAQVVHVMRPDLPIDHGLASLRDIHRVPGGERSVVRFFCGFAGRKARFRGIAALPGLLYSKAASPAGVT